MTALLATLLLSASPYAWQDGPVARRVSDIPPPASAKRVAVAPESFGAWLRGLPLKAPGTPVRLHSGRIKPNQRAHFAVTTLNTGRRNLQQCADAGIRLLAEYQWSRNRARHLSFHYTNGLRVPWSRWRAGQRPNLKQRGTWKSGAASSGRRAFEGYLRAVMTYAGTASLARHDTAPRAVDEVSAGDLLIQGGAPGHAVVVLDVARAPNGERYLLLGQSYMPAQDFHVLVNPRARRLSPWYRAADLTSPGGLRTPEWRPFTHKDLRSFRANTEAPSTTHLSLPPDRRNGSVYQRRPGW